MDLFFHELSSIRENIVPWKILAIR